MLRHFGYFLHMRAPASFTTLRQRLPTQYLWPVLLLIGICQGCLGVILTVTTRAQDDLQLAREQQFIERAVQTVVEMAIHDLQDYAKWDDAVRHIAQDLNTEWISDNVVAYLSDTQGYSHVIVLDGSDDVVFARSSGIDTAADLVGNLEFRRGLQNVRSLPVPGSLIVGGYVRLGSRVYIYTIAQIVPLTNKVVIGNEPVHLLAIARPVDPAFLQSLSKNQDVQDLRLALVPSRSDVKVALNGPAGEPQACLTWKPGTPGAELRERILPLFLVVGGLTLAAGAVIVRRGARTIAALQASEAHAHHIALHDPLTGLPNRRALVQRIEDLTATGGQVALLWHDLDGFKDVNDLYGHGAGDAVLREVQKRLNSEAVWKIA